MNVPGRADREAAIRANPSAAGGAFRWGNPFEPGRQPAIVLEDHADHVSNAGNLCRKLVLGLTTTACKVDYYIVWAAGPALDNLLRCLAPELEERGGDLPGGALRGRTCEAEIESEEDNRREGAMRPRVKWLYRAAGAPGAVAGEELFA